jgi:hypothetical protein
MCSISAQQNKSYLNFIVTVRVSLCFNEFTELAHCKMSRKTFSWELLAGRAYRLCGTRHLAYTLANGGAQLDEPAILD